MHSMRARAYLIRTGFAVFAATLVSAAVFFNLGALAAAVSAAFFVALGFFQRETRLKAFGAAFVLLPFSGTLLLYTWAILFLERAHWSVRDLKWLLPFLVPIAAWGSAQLVLNLEIAMYASTVLELWSHADVLVALSHIAAFLKANPLPGLASLESVARYAAFGILFALCRRDVSARGHILTGVMHAGAAALIVAFIQIHAEARPLLPNQNAFWQSMSRVPATFSDPNAFGVFSLLVVPLLARPCGISRFIFLLVWTVAALYSGSRTLLAGLALYVLYGGYTLLSARAASIGTHAMRALGIAIVVLGLLVAWSYAVGLPPAVLRLIPESGGTGFLQIIEGRLAFAEINILAWMQSPLVGWGVNGVRMWVPVFAEQGGYQVGLWTDNVNNFYFGLFAELGLAGAAAFVWSVLQLRWRSDASPIDRAPVVCLAVVLFLGPHLDFTEVALVSACAASQTLVVRNRRLSTVGWMLFLTATVLIFVRVSFFESGFFFWERDGQGFVRWSAPAVSGIAPCIDHQASVTALLLHPDVHREPVQVVIEWGNGDVERRELSHPGYVTLTTQCAALPHSIEHDRKVPYKLRISRGWIPALGSSSSDWRLLGLRVKYKDMAHALP